MIMSVVKIAKNGTCTIPVSIRRLMQISPGTKLIVILKDLPSGEKAITLKKRKGAQTNE